MPDITVSQDIDDFMQSADDAAARTELGLGSAATSNTTDFAQASHTHATGEITGLDSAISLNADVAANTAARHTHANKAILDATTASFTTADETKIDNISVTQPVDLDSIETDSHTHSNKAILDATTASFTTTDQTTLGTALQAGDNISVLTNDSGYITSAPVDSVNTKTGAVVLNADDIDDTTTDHKFATASQLANADSALQSGDNVSSLTNDAGYLTSALQATDIDTLAELNAILTDANLDDSSASRTPTAHTHPLTDLTQTSATDGQIIEWNNTAGEWQATSKDAFLGIACSDEATDLATGVVATFRMPHAMTLTELRASVTTAPVGSNIIVDVKEGGVSIMTTNLLNIDNGDKTSVGSATSPNITDTALADDAEITVEITQVGSTTAGAGLKLSLIGTKA